MSSTFFFILLAGVYCKVSPYILVKEKKKKTFNKIFSGQVAPTSVNKILNKQKKKRLHWVVPFPPYQLPINIPTVHIRQTACIKQHQTIKWHGIIGGNYPTNN